MNIDIKNILDGKYGNFICSDSDYNHNKLYVSMILSQNCNYNCSYCLNKTDDEKYIIKEANKNIRTRNIFNKNTNSYNFNIKYIDILMEKYLSILNPNKTINISIVGGEPTLCKNLDEIIEHIYKFRNVHICLISNGHKPIGYFENFLKKYGNKIWYEISFHSEFGNINHFVQLEDMFNRYNYTNYNIKLLLYEYFSDRIIELYSKLKNKKRIELVMLNTDKNISDKFNNILSNNTHTYSYMYKLDFENKKDVVMTERDMVYLGNKGLFYKTKCNINKNFYTLINNQLIETCSNSIFDLDNISTNNVFIEFYNKDYIICNNKHCNLDCKLRCKKYV